MKAKLASLLAQANIKISDQQIQQLIDLVNLLNKWNKAYNLTSVRDPQEMLVKHILDLLDSLGKRISFIRNAVRELGLTNVTPVLSRVEEYQPEDKFDGVLSRAFASLKDMTDWCYHLPKENGHFYALKGIYQEDEINELNKKYTIQEVIELHVPELIGERHLIVLR